MDKLEDNDLSTIQRLEKKVDMIHNQLNNDMRDLLEEYQTLKKNFTALETMFYVLFGGMGIVILLLVLK